MILGIGSTISGEKVKGTVISITNSRSMGPSVKIEWVNEDGLIVTESYGLNSLEKMLGV